jgi:hypothetical protein
LKGTTGVSGPQGAKGDLGSPGAKGDAGSTGAPGAKGATGATGAAGPTASGFASDPSVSTNLPNDGSLGSVLTLNGGSSHSGPITTHFPSRLIVTAFVKIQNLDSIGRSSQCRLVLNPGTAGAAPIGTSTYSLVGHNEIVDPALTAAIDKPAGTYNFGVECNTGTANSYGYYQGGAITVVAAARS